MCIRDRYARELFLAGEARDFLEAEDYFRAEVSSPDRSADEITEGCCVVARAARLRGAAVTFFKYTSKVDVYKRQPLCIRRFLLR